MRLLVLYPNIPFPLDRGTYQRTFHLLRSLARDHEVDLLALSEAGERLDQRAVFEAFCRRVEFVPFTHPRWPRLFPDRVLHPMPTTVRHWTLPHVGEAIRRFAYGQRYDAVHVCDIVMAQYCFDGLGQVPLVIDRSRVDLQFQLQQHAHMSTGFRDRVLTWENLAKLSRFEKRIAKRAALQVVCGPDDEAFIRANVRKDAPVMVLVNGVNLDYFRPDSTPEPRSSEPSVLFCGAMDYTPNVDALRWFFSQMHGQLLAQVPGLRTFIVGKSPLPEVQAYGRLEGVTVTGGVPDVRPHYRRAWLQIVPLRIGGGTRLKIPESMAMGTPVVSTTIGAQGLDLRHEGDILLADTPASFVGETVRALRDARLRTRLELQGLSTVQSRFSWNRIGQQLSDVYAKRFQN
jgi:glycosyltransferase involved in cell wall biosynthesis